jgi:hypothetical protein
MAMIVLRVPWSIIAAFLSQGPWATVATLHKGPGSNCPFPHFRCLATDI